MILPTSIVFECNSFLSIVAATNYRIIAVYVQEWGSEYIYLYCIMLCLS